VIMHITQTSRRRTHTQGISQDQQELPPLSSRLLEIAAINFYDEQNNTENIEDICHCVFLQSLTNVIIPHHTDIINDFSGVINEGRTYTEKSEGRPEGSKATATPTTDTSCHKIADDEIDDDEATTGTAATENGSFAAWDLVDLQHSPRPTSTILSTTISTSPLQPSTKLLQRYSSSSLGTSTCNSPKKSPSVSSSGSHSEMKVSFLAGYVSEVHVQPRVSEEDWSKVFYSPREIQLMCDDFLREGLGRVNVMISEEDGGNSNPGGPIIMGDVLEDEADCGFCYSESDSDDDENDGSSFGKVYQSSNGRQRPRAEASADKLVVGERN